MKSNSRRNALRAVVLGALAATAVAMTASSVSANYGSLNYLTFSAPVALPGVVLPRGSYAFEIANPDTTADVVRVRSRDRSGVHFLGFTRRVPRPAGLAADHALSMGEGRAGEPVPIRAWFPLGESYGHEFVW